MNLPPEIVSLLRDEAYTVLCQESLTEALAKVSQEKEKVLSTRPPFGVLASSQTRQVFQTSMRSVIDNEVGLRNRLAELTQIDAWLKESIKKALESYMAPVNPQFRCCQEAVQVVARWEIAVSALHEMSLALARDAHAVATAMNPVPSPSGLKPPAATLEQSRLRALGNLRIAVASIEAGLADVQTVRAEFVELCDAGADGLQLPDVPEFRPVGWVDKIAALSNSQCTAEAVRCEKEARDFCGDGIKQLLAQAAEVREACLDAANAILAQYWRQLRDYAQGNLVQERELDEVIAELSQHRMAAEMSRRKATFEAANITAFR